MEDRYKRALEMITSVSAFECDPLHGATLLFFLCSKMRKIALAALEEPQIDHDPLLTIDHYEGTHS